LQNPTKFAQNSHKIPQFFYFLALSERSADPAACPGVVFSVSGNVAGVVCAAPAPFGFSPEKPAGGAEYFTRMIIVAK
jgi:hypothetical protein